MTDLFKPTFLRMGVPLNKARPPTSIRPPTQTGQGNRTDLVEWSDEGPGLSGTATLPTSSAGDLLFVTVKNDSTGSVFDTPTGWTELINNSPDNDGGIATFWKIADGTEGSTVELPISVTGPPWIAGISWVHRGLDFSTYTPDVSGSIVVLGSAGTSIDPPQVSMSHGESTYDVYVVIGTLGADNGTPTSTDDYTELAEISTGTGDPSVTLFHKRIAAVEVEDPASFTFTSSKGYQAHTIAVLATGPADVAGGEHTHPVGELEDGVSGDIIYHNGTAWTILNKGSDGQVLTLASGLPSWATGGGGGAGPEWIEILASPDASGTDDDEFADDSLAGTAVAPTGTATWTENHGLLSVKFSGQSSGDHAARLFALTPSAAPVTLLTRARMLTRRTTNPMFGVVFSDGTAATSNAVAFGVYATGAGPVAARWAGTLTNMSTSNLITDLPYGTDVGWVHMMLVWTATNTWAWGLSVGGVDFTDYGSSTFAATLAPTHIGLWVSSWSQSFPSEAAFEYLRMSESDQSV